MSKLARIQGSALFGQEQWAALSARSDWRGIAMVAHAWLVIALAIAVAVRWPNPWVVTASILVIGSRQLGLAILMHDAAHGLLLNNKRWNDRIGHWLCGFPVSADLFAYRAYHLKHHRFAQQAADPDLILSAPFPITRASFVRKILRDLSGLTFLKLRVLPLLLALTGKHKLRSSDYYLLASNALFAATAWLAGALWVWLLLWLVPLATWQMLVSRLRNIAEHAGMTTEADPWRVARTTRASWLARTLVAPYFVNYHAEHHLFMWTPCYRLPGIHRALRERGLAAEHSLPYARRYRDIWQTVCNA